MLARVQKLLVLCALACALAWLAIFRTHSALFSVAGLFFLLFLPVGLLALQFVLAAAVNRHDPTAQGTKLQWVRAWLAEVIAAAQVFFWWQPFRSNAYPDHLPGNSDARSRGVVFLHGFVCNRGLWTPWLRTLRDRRIPFIALNLEPVFGSIDGYAPQVDAAVTRITHATGCSPLLVCHSMGGLVARAWLRASGGDSRVHHVITIGSPHHGTGLGDWGPALPWLANAEQMRLHSGWLAALQQDEPVERSRGFTCFHSNYDNIVFPASTATLSGANNRLVPGAAHLAMALAPDVMAESLALL